MITIGQSNLLILESEEGYKFEMQVCDWLDMCQSLELGGTS